MEKEIALTQHSMELQKYQLTLKKHIKFEARSYWGRLFLNQPPPVVNPMVNLLNLGCGNQLFDGWVNADFFEIKFWKNSKRIWMLDLRYPLNCKDNYWDGVFTEHTLEHLRFHHAFNLLKEVLRTLKPKCWLRISVPDLKKYVDFYSGVKTQENFHNYSTGAEAISSLTQNFGHLSLWDSELLERTLCEVGFVNVRQTDFAEGTDGRLLKNKEGRKWESLYMEAQKP